MGSGGPPFSPAAGAGLRMMTRTASGVICILIFIISIREVIGEAIVGGIIGIVRKGESFVVRGIFSRI